jgi:hypothetical protein
MSDSKHAKPQAELDSEAEKHIAADYPCIYSFITKFNKAAKEPVLTDSSDWDDTILPALEEFAHTIIEPMIDTFFTALLRADLIEKTMKIIFFFMVGSCESAYMLGYVQGKEEAKANLPV